jgi:Glycosyl transferase family 2
LTAAQPENLPEQLVAGVRLNSFLASEEHQWSGTDVAAQFNSVRAIPSIRLLSKLSILMSARVSRATHPLPLNGDLECGAEGIPGSLSQRSRAGALLFMKYAFLPDCTELPERGTMVVQGGSRVPWPRVSAVIPTLNEARNLPHVFSRLPAGLHEVIVVDGHSVDDTPNTARRLRPGVRTITQSRTGKGNAVACGFAAATGDIVVMLDADGSADPREIPRFVHALLAGADFALGSRFAAGGGSRDITRLRQLGNRALVALVNVRYGTKYSDLCYGYIAFWRRHLPALGLDAVTAPPPEEDCPLWGDGFEIETLMHLRVAASGLVTAEVPSFEYPRIHGVSNLRAVSDGLRVLRTIVKERRASHDLAAVSGTNGWPAMAPPVAVPVGPPAAPPVGPATAPPAGPPPVGPELGRHP